MIALFVRDGMVRPFIGDILVVVLMYTFVRGIIPVKIRFLPLYLLLFSISVEFAQYFRIVEILGLQSNVFFSTLIGTSFDVRDIVCYICGTMLLLAWEWVEKRGKSEMQGKHG